MICCSIRPGRDRPTCVFAYLRLNLIHNPRTDRDRRQANLCPCSRVATRWLWPDDRDTNAVIPSRWHRVAHVDTRTCSVRSVRVAAIYKSIDALPSRPRSCPAQRPHSSLTRSSRRADRTSSRWSIWRRANSRCDADGSNSNVYAGAGTRRDAEKAIEIIINNIA